MTNPVALRLPARRASSTASSTTADAGTRVEMEQLIGAEAEDFDDLRVEAIDRTLRERDDQVIEGRAPAQDAGGDFGGERAIAVVGQR